MGKKIVAFYPINYNVEGGLVVVKPDGTREFNIRDHIGNVRATIVMKIGQFSFKNYDYKPYGDTLWTSEGQENAWRGYAGESKDLESEYMNLGARVYDPQIGRFLSVDPLLLERSGNPDLSGEAFHSQSAYSYSFNNPISYSDPTGFAPEKEKGGGNNFPNNFVIL